MHSAKPYSLHSLLIPCYITLPTLLFVFILWCVYPPPSGMTCIYLCTNFGKNTFRKFWTSSQTGMSSKKSHIDNPGLNVFKNLSLPRVINFKFPHSTFHILLHHQVWRTWLFIAYSDEKWLSYQILTAILTFLCKRLGEFTLNLGMKGFKESPHISSDSSKKCQFLVQPALYHLHPCGRFCVQSTKSMICCCWQ